METAFKSDTFGNVRYYPTVPAPKHMGSYDSKEVTFLLKDIGPFIKEQNNQDRERAIQGGAHYSEMLPIEYKPTKEYVNLFHRALQETGQRIALATSIVSQLIYRERGPKVVLVSLARAGTPIGVLIRRYLKYFYFIEAPHYSISIIRDKGIDKNALIYILQNHPGYEIQFIDGWTGKGAITHELYRALDEFEKEFHIKPGVINNELAVLADPGHCANIFGTRDDFLIPSACLNSTVSGLVSRTVCRDDLVKDLDFHGAKFYRELLADDLSNYYIDGVAGHFDEAHKNALSILNNDRCFGIDKNPGWVGQRETKRIQMEFGISSINYVKPGVGETTRVLLRRVPWKILAKDINSPDIKHVKLLAKDRGVPMVEYPHMSYSCCGLIKELGAGQ